MNIRQNVRAGILLFSLVWMLLLSACSSNTDSNQKATVDHSTIQKNDDTDKNDGAAQKIVNDEGVEFTAVAKENGEVVDNAAPLSSNTIVLEGKTYEFPVRISTFIEDGWTLPSNVNFKNEFDANASTNLISFYLKKGDVELSLRSLYNDSDSVKGIEECLLTGFEVYYYTGNSDTEVVFPGGITPRSTSVDILNILGNPNSNNNFESGYNLDARLTYTKHKDSNISYSFSFIDGDEFDGAEEYIGYIYSISIEWEK